MQYIASPTESIQIALYSESIGEIQRKLPEHMCVKNPDEELKYRVNDYISYLRLIKRSLNAAIEHPIGTYPEPCSHCDICDWWEYCNKIRRKDDHLSFIAGMGTSQIKEVNHKTFIRLKQWLKCHFLFPSNLKKDLWRLLQNFESRQEYRRKAE